MKDNNLAGGEAPETTPVVDGAPQEPTETGEWQNLHAVKAIAAGVAARHNDMFHGMRTGKIRNNAHNRGYMQALLDLHHNLTYLTDVEEEAS